MPSDAKEQPYKHMPYEEITEDQYNTMTSKLKPIDWSLANLSSSTSTSSNNVGPATGAATLTMNTTTVNGVTLQLLDPQHPEQPLPEKFCTTDVCEIK